MGIKTKTFISLLAIFAVVIVIGLIIKNNSGGISQENLVLEKFSSEEEFNDFVKQTIDSGEFYYGGDIIRTLSSDVAMETSAPLADKSSSGSAEEYSTTNIQVEGVDEADMIKNDGKYIYVLSGQTIYIIEAYPAENMNIVGKIEAEGSIGQFFLNKDKIIIFGYGYNNYVGIAEEKVALSSVDSSKPDSITVDESTYSNYVRIYDITDRQNPKIEREIGMDGNYINSRMIGDYIYVVSTKYIYSGGIQPPIYYLDGAKMQVGFDEIYMPYYRDTGYQFTSISAIGIEDESFETETYLMGNSYNMYMSQDNIYLTQPKEMDYGQYYKLMYEKVYEPMLPSEYKDRIEKVFDYDELKDYEKFSKMQEIASEYFGSLEVKDSSEIAEELQERFEDFNKASSKLQKTAIYKINVDENKIIFIESGLVPGNILNQFSMDEYEGNLRVTTTSGGGWGFFGSSSSSSNNLYILDENMKIIGSVEDLASGERIYSTRFMKDKAYMVTYRNVDPLFVIDTSNPTDPEVLGYLKVSGYSSYLHPYDETHLIGIGMETESLGEDRTINQGVKISLFDVSDFENPVEVDKIEVGDRGTSTSAMYEHKTVLFDKERSLLVIPIDLYESKEDSTSLVRDMWGRQTWVGVYVFDIDSDSIDIRGKITHMDDESKDEKEYYNYYSDAITRSLYMDDVLYTISEYKVKANVLESLEEIDSLQIREKEEYLYPIYY